MRPRTHLLIAAALAAPVALVAGRGLAGGPLLASSSGIDDLLSGVDYVPDKPVLDDALGDLPDVDLMDIATSDAEDPGVRVRAYRALAHYPSDETRIFLITAVNTYAAASEGIDVLYLRAAMHSLAEVAGSDAVLVLDDLLDSSSRDIRADAALSLAETGSGAALPFLRARLTVETVEQVRWALKEAINVLTAP